MPLYEGILDEYLALLVAKEAQIEPLEITEIVIQILSGLYHCYVQGFCHRNLKLSNGIVLC